MRFRLVAFWQFYIVNIVVSVNLFYYRNFMYDDDATFKMSAECWLCLLLNEWMNEWMILRSTSACMIIIKKWGARPLVPFSWDRYWQAVWTQHESQLASQFSQYSVHAAAAAAVALIQCIPAQNERNVNVTDFLLIFTCRSVRVGLLWTTVD